MSSYSPSTYGFSEKIFFFTCLYDFVFLVLRLRCFLLRWCFCGGVFRRWGISMLVFWVLGCFFGIRRCCIFCLMDKICLFVWMFFHTILICILSCLVVCIIQFFVVFVTIWCFGTFLWCLNRVLENWWLKLLQILFNYVVYCLKIEYFLLGFVIRF